MGVLPRLVLLILLILTRAAARMADGAVAGVALAGLGGVPPLGVFPGLVLVVLVLSNHDPWLLLPLAVGFTPILSASLPHHFPSRALDHSAQDCDPLDRLAAFGPCCFRRLLRAGRPGALVPHFHGGPLMAGANNIIRTAEAEMCRPWLRHILSHADWTALAFGIGHGRLDFACPLGRDGSGRMRCSSTPQR